MFEALPMAPPDAILGLTEAFKADPNPEKINLGVGIYKDDQGQTPILSSVKQAEERLLAQETSKSYLPISGAPEYGAAVQGLLFGGDSEIVRSRRAVTAHTPGGTGALRVGGDFVKMVRPEATVWVSAPTWENHIGVFEAAGLAVSKYPYYDAAKNALNFTGMIDALRSLPEGDVVLLHACCHNPSGMDPTAQQWAKIAEVIAGQKLLPFIDFAYQGFGQGIEEDAEGLRAVCAKVGEVLVASSLSKNFGLYNERVGALTVVCDARDAAEKAFSHVKLSIRRNYSNPPSHGGAIATLVLSDPGLRGQWEKEVAAMRGRIQQMRHQFVATLKAKGVQQDFSFITGQNGMFSFSGLNPQQVAALRKQYAIYIVGSGRINVAGMTPGNMDRLCSAIAEVMKT